MKTIEQRMNEIEAEIERLRIHCHITRRMVNDQQVMMAQVGHDLMVVAQEIKGVKDGNKR